MAWWSIGEDDMMGDKPGAISAESFACLKQLRETAGAPPPRYEDVVTVLASVLSRSGREVTPRSESQLTGLTARFEGGAPEVHVKLDAAKPPADELAIGRDWMKRVAAEYREGIQRRPSFRELLASATVALKPMPNPHLALEETRVLAEFVPVFQHKRGQLTADDVVSAIAAALRRNERRLGLLVEDGASMSPDSVVATTADGREIGASCKTADPARTDVEEICERFENITRQHRQELPEAELASLPAHDRELREQRANARGLPKLDGFVETTRALLAAMPERYEPLATLKVVTSARSPVGLPSRATQAFVEGRLRVKHTKFGEGFVDRVIDEGGETKYDVMFDGGKRVTLLARFVEKIA